jgi:hypothetical protein
MADHLSLTGERIRKKAPISGPCHHKARFPRNRKRARSPSPTFPHHLPGGGIQRQKEFDSRSTSRIIIFSGTEGVLMEETRLSGRHPPISWFKTTEMEHELFGHHLDDSAVSMSLPVPTSSAAGRTRSSKADLPRLKVSWDRPKTRFWLIPPPSRSLASDRL